MINNPYEYFLNPVMTIFRRMLIIVHYKAYFSQSILIEEYHFIQKLGITQNWDNGL